MPGLARFDGSELVFTLHDGQKAALKSDKPIVLLLGGSQSGKTSTGPPWLFEEIRRRGPGDYLVAAPTYPLLDKKALPEFLGLFKTTLNVGTYSGGSRQCFTFSRDGAMRVFGRDPGLEQTRVYFGHAQEPDSLEAMTAKGAWLDEAGQNKFKVGSWEAIQRRLGVNQGRCLITTTPYSLGWMYQRVYLPGRNGDPRVEVIRFESTANPAFPREEYERAKRELPRWKFDLFYRAIFTRPAGIIYEAFDPDAHVCDRFPVPDDWSRYLGLDFGGVHTAGVFFAEEPKSKRLYLYREYMAGGRTAKQHAAVLRQGEPNLRRCVGGSKSEDQWRDEFTAAGLTVDGPAVTDVEVGITRVYGCFAREEVTVFRDCEGWLDEVASYRRAVDDAGQPTEQIEDKETFHRLDATRYILNRIRPGYNLNADPKSGLPAAHQRTLVPVPAWASRR